MLDPTKATSEWARKRAAGKILREALIKRRETYFDLLVSGYSIEQIATYTKKSPAAVRRAVGQALAKRQLDAPADYARLQVVRLTKALRCADVSLEEGDLKAIAPFVQVVRELKRQCWPGATDAGCAGGNRADVRAACAHAFARRRRWKLARGRKKLRKGGVKPLKSFARVNLCADVTAIPPAYLQPSNPSILPGFDSMAFVHAAYWVRWPDCVTAANRAASA
jgi:hypothetical protein